jgi:lysosomal acid lipase/cholesteryl ester hydrolase
MYSGTSCSVETFIVNVEDKAMALMFANAGIDVWILNNRGSLYDTQHLDYDAYIDSEYWDFSYEEMGLNDLPIAF